MTPPPTDAPQPWHALSVEKVCELLVTSPAGLAEAAVAPRLASFGPNEIHPPQHVSPWRTLLDQFKNVLIIILLVAALLSAFLGHEIEAAAIAVIVLFAALLGFIQEYRAERAMEALRAMAAPAAAVVRDGVEREVPAREVVPGDLLVLRAGDRVAADLRLVEAVNLQMDEASLTGESVSVDKGTAPVEDASAQLGDRSSIAYAGTAVAYGRGRGVVVATGMNTEAGKIAGMLAEVKSARTPLQESLDRVGRLLARAVLVGVAVIVVLGLFRGEKFIEMLIFGIALAVAAVPEALPAVVTISLAMGLQRMAKRHALMRRLAAVETLGCTTVICSDKTGTLTKDEMTVRQIHVAGETYQISGAGYRPAGAFSLAGATVAPSPLLEALLEAALLASDAELFHDDATDAWSIKGDPTEAALVVAGAKAGLEKAQLDRRFPRQDEIPFTSETKRMTTLVAGKDSVMAYAKGAPESILSSCSHILTAAGEVPLDAALREEIKQAALSMGSQALRVLAVARKSGAKRGDAETGLTFLGLAGMIDPPRPEALSAIRTCREAGIRPVMITGDHPITAEAVARELGLLAAGRVVTGAQLEAMDEEQLEREVQAIDLYARVSPAHKLRVVSALQKNREIVAMTGDGVNDAPALKKADIGIAMGISGTAVSREAAAMTLTDDNFASIVAAVEEGRRIFDNIKKYLMYLLSSNLGEVGLVAAAMLLGLPLPLSAVQILYVNLATDGLPALALALDPPDAEIMRRPPRGSSSGIFTTPVVALILCGGLWSTLVNLSVFSWARAAGRSEEEAMTVTFVTLVLIEFFKSYNFRSDRHSVLRRPFANRWLNAAIVWELILLLVIVYLPALQRPFGSYPLPLRDWLIALGAAFSVCPILELAKWLARRGAFGRLG
jgi:P-type Ca2+ transporter type 2C